MIAHRLQQTPEWQDAPGSKVNGGDVVLRSALVDKRPRP